MVLGRHGELLVPAFGGGVSYDLEPAALRSYVQPLRSSTDDNSVAWTAFPQNWSTSFRRPTVFADGLNGPGMVSTSTDAPAEATLPVGGSNSSPGAAGAVSTETDQSGNVQGETSAAEAGPNPDELQKAKAELRQTQEQEKLEKELASKTNLGDDDALAEGKVKVAVDHANEMAKVARVWTERAAAMMEANRLEQAQDAAVKATEDVAKMIQPLPRELRSANEALQAVYADRANLKELKRLGGTVDPDEEVKVLSQLASHAEDASKLLLKSADAGRRVAAFANSVKHESLTSQPLLRKEDVHLAPLTNAEGADIDDDVDAPTQEDRDAEMTKAHLKMQAMDDGEPSGLTAAGCQCDPQVKCGLQGRSFTWCRVGGGHCELLRQDGSGPEHAKDMAGVDHNLYTGAGVNGHSGQLEQSGAMWDYCTPKFTSQSRGSAPLTAHGGRCAWRGDLLKRYVEDPLYNKNGSLDLSLVPFKDRAALELMLKYREDPSANSLCSPTAGSQPFSVCPVSSDPERPELSGRGWLANHSWDFCAAKNWRPAKKIGNDVSDAQGAPLAPELPQRDIEPPEESREELGEVIKPERGGMPPELAPGSEEKIVEQNSSPLMFAALLTKTTYQRKSQNASNASCSQQNAIRHKVLSAFLPAIPAEGL
eukprot:TRINITY_DN108745_c0_g1_i1.p1 TRINITY_DN108745_c0_g1~~TRINITY_DN108745_c0_g1_i1.p1  ORF type:complete len:652 (+),score=170.37 TRINITY_DN108745_c0_g1_i1:107-2062(+)